MHASWLKHRSAYALGLVAAVCLSCVTTKDEGEAPPVGLTPAEVAQLLPPHVKDRAGWAADIVAAIEESEHLATPERACAVIAVIEQESNFDADPPVPHLPRIVRTGLEKKLERLGALSGPALAALLAGKAPGTKATFGQRIDKLRTERDLDRLFRDIELTYKDAMPGTFVVASALSRIFGKGALQDMNPVTTAGSMQVKVGFARQLPGLDDMSDEQIREYLYTRAGGVRAGSARLLGYPASYDDVVYRFADYNAGEYSSRNAAFQAMLRDLTGEKIVADGDLLAYEADGGQKAVETKSLHALLAFGKTHDVSTWAINRAVNKEKSAAFEETDVWGAVREAWEAKTHKHPPYARIPDVTLTSPKLARPRSTAWFATSVKKRYDACRARQSPQLLD